MYLAKWEEDEEVVVKHVCVDDRGHNIASRDWRHEVFMMCQAKHPNLVAIFGIIVEPMAIVMEYCPFKSLRIVLESKSFDPKGFTPKLQLKIISDVARGMGYLHSITPPIIHRDLRSDNVFVRWDSFHYPNLLDS